MNQLLNQQASQSANQPLNLIREVMFYLINRVTSFTVYPLSVTDAGREIVFQSHKEKLQRTVLAQCHCFG